MLLLRELIGEENALERTVEEMDEITDFDIFSLYEEDIDVVEKSEAVDTVEVNPYPEGSIFNPVNAWKSKVQVNREEVILTASLETVDEIESKEEQNTDDVFSLLDLLFGDSSNDEASDKESICVTSVASKKKSKSRKALDTQEFLF